MIFQKKTRVFLINENETSNWKTLYINMKKLKVETVQVYQERKRGRQKHLHNLNVRPQGEYLSFALESNLADIIMLRNYHLKITANSLQLVVGVKFQYGSNLCYHLSGVLERLLCSALVTSVFSSSGGCFIFLARTSILFETSKRDCEDVRERWKKPKSQSSVPSCLLVFSISSLFFNRPNLN